jgi:hypothetical protein
MPTLANCGADETLESFGYCCGFVGSNCCQGYCPCGQSLGRYGGRYYWCKKKEAGGRRLEAAFKAALGYTPTESDTDTTYPPLATQDYDPGLKDCSLD